MPQIQSSKLHEFITDHLATSLSDESCCSRVTQYEKSNSSFSTKNLVLKIQELMEILKNTQSQNMSLRIQQAELRKQLATTKRSVIQELFILKNNKNDEHYYEQSINQDLQYKNQRNKEKIQNNHCKQQICLKNGRKWSNFGSLQQVPEESKRVYRSYLNSPNKQKYIQCKTNININNKQLKLKIEELQLSSNGNSNYQICSPRKAGSISKTRRNLSQKYLQKFAKSSNFNLETDSTQRILNKNKQKNDSKLIIPDSIDQLWNKNDSQKTIVKCGTRKIIKKNNIRKSYLE